MPSDRYYDELDEAEDRRRIAEEKSRYERKKQLIDEISKMTTKEKVEFLIDVYISKIK